MTAFLQKIQDRRFVLGSITGEELRQKFDAIAHVICGADHDLLKLIERNVFGGDERKRNFPKG
ncbi:MAG: hypothetical protein LBG52_02505 [Candidatus Peribacteria bacterium]|nr:hypothetical protein [Candidatus Peribacteria bacterium]